MIITYANQDGHSGIQTVDISDSHVDIEFKNGGTYRYTESSVGYNNLVIMKTLAKAGRGLNRFINKHVRFNYQTRTDVPKPIPTTPQLTSQDATDTFLELLATGKVSLLVN